MKGQPSRTLWLLVLLNVLVAGLSMFLGRYHIPGREVLQAFAAPLHLSPEGVSPIVSTVLFHVRLPRILMAMVVGAGLGITGASFQGVFRNPLVSPYILGVSSGGGFGAALAILLFSHGHMIQVITFFIARLGYRVTTYTLVLAGVVVGSFFTALISLLKYVADTYTKLPAIVFWLMGSLASVSMDDVWQTAPLIVAGIVILVMLRWRFNVLSLGTHEAQRLGVNTTWLYGVIIVCSTVIASSIVAVAGIIGWVGLVVPHLSRMLVGADHERLLPAAALMGSAYMLVVDGVARVMSAQEIPLGIVTAIIGAPFFAYLLKRRPAPQE